MGRSHKKLVTGPDSGTGLDLVPNFELGDACIEGPGDVPEGVAPLDDIEVGAICYALIVYGHGFAGFPDCKPISWMNVLGSPNPVPGLDLSRGNALLFGNVPEGIAPPNGV